MHYRREIDGLRALAVLPVILFHAGIEAFSGGFVGVDVFFVISGYLITTIILAELEQGKFSIIKFYERRARRILPALFLVMLISIPFAWFLLSPYHFVEFSRSLIAIVFFSSNILFWKESGYFANAASEKPLLHTWSLAVEEQYYVLFPLFLLVFWRLGKRWILVTLGLAFFASLGLAQWGSHAKPDAAFYLLPTRGWELLIGSFAAFYLSRVNRMAFGKVTGEAFGWLGLTLIFYSVFTYSKAVPFPSFYTLIPTLGTVLIILFATEKTMVGNFIGNKVFVGIGLISYSAYLWHQPLFAYAKQIGVAEDNNLVFLALSSLTIVLAYLSWRFVEAPFRSSSRFSRVSILKFATLFFITFTLIGSLGEINNGFLNRLTFHPSNKVSESDLRAVMDQYGFRLYPKPKSFQKDVDSGLMRLGNGKGKGVLLIGDSHAQQYWNTFEHFYGQSNTHGDRKTLYIQDVSFLPNFEKLNLKNDIDTVVISYFWAFRYGSPSVNQYIRCCGDGPKGVVGVQSAPNSADVMDQYDKKLSDVIEKLKQRSIRIILVLDNPFGEELNAQSMLRVDGLNIYPTEFFTDLDREVAISRTEPVRSRLIEIAKNHGAKIIDPFQYLCDDDSCKAVADEGYMRYKDYDHYSLKATTIDAAFILKVLDSTD